jgi:hypothetical protein
MNTSRKLLHGLIALSALIILSTSALAADPGIVYPATSEISDQKAGSILFYTAYASNATAPATENTRANITNTSSTSAAFVHLFFIDGSTCSVADSFVCLTANQTATFLFSEIDPGVRGYAIAIAVDGVFGCPINFNFLIGDWYVKYASGHSANLGAEAVAAIAAFPALCDANTGAATILFNNINYNYVPRVLASSNIPSRLDGNDTLWVIIRTGGSLFSPAGSIGTIFGILYDDGENVFSYNIPFSGCQRIGSLSDTFPRTVPRFTQVIPAGRTGWSKFWSQSDVGLLGVQINYNANAAANNPLHPGDFNGGHNLHKLTLTTDTYTMPVFAPSC